MLLIDTLLNSPVCGNVDDRSWIKFKQRLREAQKFELAPDFAAAAEHLAENFDAIVGAIPHCRVPYAETWIEVAQIHRPRYFTAEIHAPEFQSVPHRIGFLLTAVSEDMSVFNVHQFWDITGVGHNASYIAMNFDPKRGDDAPPIGVGDDHRYRYVKMEKAPSWLTCSAEARGKLSRIIQPILTDYTLGPGQFPRLMRDRDEMMEVIFELGVADWSGEQAYILATLALMNTINAVELKPANLTKLNAARRKRNTFQLANHYTLSISSRIKSRIVGGAGSSKDRFGNLRAHLVRGHWKVRKSGIYWWRPFMRGDSVRGVISKKYKLE